MTDHLLGLLGGLLIVAALVWKAADVGVSPHTWFLLGLAAGLWTAFVIHRMHTDKGDRK